MSEPDTMLHLPMLSDMSTIIPATPAVWCDPGVRIELEQRRADVWCDPGARIFGQDVWCDPGVRLQAVDPPAPAALAARVEEALDIWAFAPAEEDEEPLPELELPRFVPQQAHIPLPTIPTQLTFEERVTQRCHALCERLGWEIGVSLSLLEAVLHAGTPDQVLVRVVEDHDEARSLRTLHTAWELRRLWFDEGPLTGWMTWHHAVVLVSCWHHDTPDAEELASWLDDAFSSWQRARPYIQWWVFHEELVDWLDEEGPDALLYAEFPWDEQLLDDHTPTPRW